MDKFEERKDKINNIIKYINMSAKEYPPFSGVNSLYFSIVGNIDKEFSGNRFPALSNCPQYVYDNDSTLFITNSNSTYITVVFRNNNSYQKDKGFIINSILYYHKRSPCQRSFNIVDERLVLGDVTETKYETLLDILYKLSTVNSLMQKFMPQAKFKKYLPENRNIKLIFDNDVSIDISEVLLSMYSPVYNMLYNRDNQFLSKDCSDKEVSLDDKIAGIWHLPGNPTPRLVQLIKDQITSNNTRIKDSLSLDELNIYVEIILYMGLNYDFDS